MEKKLLHSGIDVIGDVPWGTHFCHFFQTKEDLLDVLVPYFRAGLEGNEFCIWVTADPLGKPEVERAMASAVPGFARYVEQGQIEIIPYDQWYTLGGHFDSDRVLAGWVDKLEQALKRGYGGLRLTGNTFWLEKQDWRSFADYEAAVDGVIGSYRILALCSYSLDKCGGGEVLDVVRNHEFALARREGRWDLIETATYKRAKEALAQSETRSRELLAQAEQERNRLKALVDTSPVGMFVTDTSGDIVLANREALRVFGFPRLERDLSRYVAAAVRLRPDGSPYKADELPIHRALRTGERVYLEEIRYEFAGGRAVTTLVSVTPISSSEGETTGAIVVIQDISRLDDTEKRRNEFLGVVSHELRSPLTAIKGAAATALGSPTVDYTESRELLRIIDQQADRLRDLVSNLTDITRIEAGAFTINPQATDIRNTLNEALAVFSHAFKSRVVRLDLAVGLPPVRADSRRIIQVLTNLLSNAAKFSPPATPINLEVEQDNAHIKFRVRDQGRGIPPDGLPHLFRKYSQLHDGSGEPVSGTGLGLAICKGIVQAHAGRIWAESAGEGRGTTITFTLPVAVETPAAATAVAEAPVSAGARKLARVLAVDDDFQVLRYVRRTLEDGGYEAIVASDPSVCTNLVQQEQPDVVLMDFRFPDVTGLDLLKRIREFSEVPVVFLTGSDEGDNAARALKAGADDYIVKPFSPSELLARIEVVLRRRGPGGPT
ncbi:MAG: MEDS domain-containing protein [Chloroflexi bacterium]|nr:MEDS domain-containing protein [Chloroflexota bacterium]